eukprot:11636043-Ditylum_brightwellii.AAC.1
MIDGQSASTEVTGAAAIAQDTAGTPCLTSVIGSKRQKKTSTEDLVPSYTATPPQRRQHVAKSCCDCTRHSTYAQSSGSRACACRRLRRHCTSCACWRQCCNKVDLRPLHAETPRVGIQAFLATTQGTTASNPPPNPPSPDVEETEETEPAVATSTPEEGQNDLGTTPALAPEETVDQAAGGMEAEEEMTEET